MGNWKAVSSSHTTSNRLLSMLISSGLATVPGRLQAYLWRKVSGGGTKCRLRKKTEAGGIEIIITIIIPSLITRTLVRGKALNQRRGELNPMLQGQKTLPQSKILITVFSVSSKRNTRLVDGT